MVAGSPCSGAISDGQPAPMLPSAQHTSPVTVYSDRDGSPACMCPVACNVCRSRHRKLPTCWLKEGCSGANKLPSRSVNLLCRLAVKAAGAAADDGEAVAPACWWLGGAAGTRKPTSRLLAWNSCCMVASPVCAATALRILHTSAEMPLLGSDLSMPCCNVRAISVALTSARL